MTPADVLSGVRGAVAIAKAIPKRDNPGALVLQVSPKKSGRFAVDIVFIHGIGGDLRSTWCPDTCETDHGILSWIHEDLQRKFAAPIRVLTAGYQSSLTNLEGVRQQTINTRAREVYLALRHAGVGERPSIFVCHSMGGIIAKELCRIEADGREKDPLGKSVMRTMRGLVLLATPSQGSDVSNLARMATGLLGSGILTKEAEELATANSSYLTVLQNAFVRLLDTHFEVRPRVFGYHEQDPYSGALVVPAASALEGCDNKGGAVESLPGNHASICKPRDRNTATYRELFSVLANVISTVSRTSSEAPDVDSLDAHLPRKESTDQTKGAPLPEAPKPIDRDAPHHAPLMRRGIWAIALIVLVGLAGVAYRARQHAQEKHARHRVWNAAQAFQDRHGGGSSHNTDASFVVASSTGTRRPKTVGEVLVERNSELREFSNEFFVRAAHATIPLQRPTPQLVLLTGPGGVGKGPVIRFLSVDPATGTPRAGIVKADLSDARKREDVPRRRYLHVPGVIDASLPELPESILHSGERSDSAGLPALVDAFNSSTRIDWRNIRGVVIDAFDEIGPSSRARIFGLALAWLRADPSRTVVIAGRGEVFRDLAREEDEVSRVIRVEPLYVGEGAALRWFLADFACYTINNNRLHPAMRPSRAVCESVTERTRWARTIESRLGRVSPLVRSLAYTTHPANQVFESLLNRLATGVDIDHTHTATISEEFVVATMERSEERHGRPPSTARVYRDLLGKAAAFDPHELAGRPTSVGLVSGLWWRSAMTDELLELSGFIDIVPVSTFSRTAYEFFPPVVQISLICGNDAQCLAAAQR